MFSKVILLLSALFVFGDGAPLNIESSDVCSTQCSEAENLFYEIGKTYVYDFDTKTELKLEDQIVNVRITGLAHLHYAKKCEFRLQLRNVRVEGVDKKQLRAEDLQRETLTFAFNDGLISNVCPSLGEKSNILNIKKAILSAMQVSTKMLGPLKVVEERDILGDCETEYKTEKQGTITITKKKNLKTCRNRMIANTALFQNAILERMLERSTEVMQNNYECTQVISENKIMQKVECRETSHYMDYSRESIISLELNRIEETQIANHEFKKQSLLYSREDDHVVNIDDAFKLLHQLCQSTVNDINDQSMKYFKRLSYALKGLEYEDINRMLSQVQIEGGINGCISMKLHGMLESALLMSGGKAALRYMTEDIRSLDTSNPRKMMTLLSLPFISQPTEESVKAILPMMSNIKSPRLMLLATAMIGNFVRNNASCPETMPAVKDAVNLLGSRLPNKCASNPREIKNVVALLKAIGNIGYLTEEVFQMIVGCAKSTSTESVVRAAALNVLKKSNACNEPSEQSTELKTLLNILMTKSEETDEIQIAAFKAFMSCSKGFGEEFIVKEAIVMSRNRANPRLAHYVYTYLNNLKKNKNPMYRKLRMEMITKDITDITEKNERLADEKMSQNKLYTYYSNELQMGIHFEMDYIMERNLKHPRALTVSAYIPIHERNIQLFEIGVRQEIDDQSISNLEKFLMEQNYEELLNIAKDMINERWSDINQEKMEKLQQLLMKLHESVKMLSMHFDYNENTLFCGSYSFMDSFIRREFKREAFLGWAQGRGRPSMAHLSNHPMIAKIKNVFKERGYGLILVDSSIETPTVSGLPEIAAARSVFVSGSTGVRERQNMINLMPNMGISICLSIKTFINREEMVGLKWKTTAVSNLRMIVKITNNDNEKSIELNLPSAKTDLIKFTSALYKDTEAGEQMYSMEGTPKKECERDMFGLTACMVNHISPEFDLLKVQQFWISLEHSHGNNDGWKATLVYPNSRNNKYMIELKAPRLNNNFMRIEAMETMDIDKWVRYDIKYNTQYKSIKGEFAYRLLEEMLGMKIEFNNDNDNHMLELSLERTLKTFSESRFVAKMKAKSRFIEPFEMTYSISTKDEPKMKSMNTELIFTRRGNNRMRLLKGDISMDENMKTIAHLQIGNQKINRWFNMMTVLQMNEYLSIDSSIDYKTIQMTKSQKIAMHAKFNDKSSSRMVRIESMAEVTFTQWPEYNTHINNTLMYKPSEHFENEFILKWKGKMDSEKRMINVLLISKTMWYNDGTKGMENRMMYLIGPMAIKHELMHKATVRGGDLNMFKHEVKLMDLMNDRSSEGHIMYEQVSRSPMKMLGNVWWKSPSDEKKFTYEFNEMNPNKYKEIITLRQQNVGETPFGYIIQTISSTSEKPNFDTQITVNRIESNEQIASFKINAQFGNVQQIKSDFKYKSEPVYEFEHFWDKYNKDLKQKLMVHGFGKIETSMEIKNNEVATYKIDGMCFVCNSEHHSELMYDTNPRHAEYGFRVKSKTIYKSKLVYNMNMRKLWNKGFICEISTEEGNMKVEHVPMPNGYRAMFTLQTGDIFHKTTISKDGRSTNGLSETKVSGNMLFDAKYKRMDGELKLMKVDIPNTFTMNYELTDDHKHLFKVTHPKSKLFHETTLEHGYNDYMIDLKSKTIKDSDNVYDMKLMGKYENSEKYDLKTQLNVMKRLRFNFGMKSSPNAHDMNMRLQDSLISRDPINYEMRTLRTRSKREVMLQNGNDKYGFKTFTDSDNSYNVVFRGPHVTSKLRLYERDFKFTAEGGAMKHETSLKYDADGSSNFLTTTLLDGKEVFLIKRRKTDTKRDTEMDNPFFKLHFIGERVTPKEDRVTLTWTNKHKKQDRKLEFTKLEEGNTLIVTFKLIKDMSQPDKAYDLRVEGPLKYEKGAQIKFTSKGLQGCDSDGTLDYEYPNYKLQYNRKCAAHKYNIKMERKMDKNSYQHELDIKRDGADLFNLDTKAKMSDDGNTLTIKSQVKSPGNKQFDGAYFDYKREVAAVKDAKQAKFNLAFKPIMAERLFTLIGDATYKQSERPQKVTVIRANLKGAVENTKTNEKYTREYNYESENILHASAKLTKEVGGKVELISSRSIHYDKLNGDGYMDLVFTPTNSMANLSVHHTKGECDVKIVAVHTNVDLIRFESQRKHLDNGNEDVEGKGTILGFPVTTKLLKTAEKTTFSLGVKPVAADYPFKPPLRMRKTDCYEASSEDCISLGYETDNVKNKLNTVNAKIKVNHQGDKFTKTYLYENMDTEGKRERKLTVKNDKEGSTIGYHYTRQENHCEAEIFLRADRIIRYVRNTEKTGDKEHTKIEAWMDFKRKPDQKLTIDRTVEGSEEKQTRKTIITHPILKKPITITCEHSNTKAGNAKTQKGKVEIDYSEDPNEKLTLEVEGKSDEDPSNRQEKNHEYSIKLYRADKTIDISHKHISLKKLSAALKLRNYLKHTEWKSAAGELQSVIQKLDYKKTIEDGITKITKHIINKRLSHYFEYESELVHKNQDLFYTIERADITLKEGGPKYRINSTKWEKDNLRCMKFNGFNLPVGSGPMKYVQACIGRADKPLFDLSAGEEGKDLKTIDVTVSNKPNTERMYVFALKWNPDVVKARISAAINKISERIESANNAEKELKKEKERLTKLILEPIKKRVIEPMGQHIGQELGKICDENPRYCTSSHRPKRAAAMMRSPSESKLIKLFKVLSTFRMVSYNPQKGEIIFEMGIPN